MQTTDFILMLELVPNVPLTVEYLPGMFADKGFDVVSIQNVSVDNIQNDGKTNQNEVETHLHIRENHDDSATPLLTKDLLSLFAASEENENYYKDTKVKVKFGNQDFQTAVLDITEVELFQKTLTMKLFFTNQVPKDWKKTPKKQDKVQGKRNKKRLFSAFSKKMPFTIFQSPKWSPQWLLSIISK